MNANGEELRARDGLVLRATTPDDTGAIAKLLATVFPSNPKSDEDIMRWQYWAGPWGPAIGLVWERDGEIVCHLARLQVPMLIGGERCMGGISVDGATLPEFRGRGIYAELNHELNVRCAQRGLSVGFSFLSTRFAPGPHMPTAVARLPMFVRSTRRRSLRRRPRLRAMDVRRTSEPPPGLNDLCANAAGDVYNGIIRGDDWWRWRYGSRPHATYEFFSLREDSELRSAAAVAVTDTRGRRVAHVLELLTVDPVDARAIVERIGRTYPDVTALVAWGTMEASGALMRAVGLRRVPARVDPNPVNVNVWPLTPVAERAMHGAWTVAGGDFDHV